ncbi:hypothetical protein Tco_1577699 [Tanacetum coccineum]
MNPNSSIYRGLMKRGKRFMKLPLNLGRRSFLDNSWPFDEGWLDEIEERGIDLGKLGCGRKKAGKLVKFVGEV